MWHTVPMDSTELKRIADAYRRAQKRADERRAVLFDAIREIASYTDDRKVKQVEIVEATGFTRDYIRKIVNPEAAKPKAKRKTS